MQKKPQNFNCKVNGTYLRRSDLQAVAEMWQPAAAGVGLTIETDGHTFESVEELVASQESARQISLTRRYSKPPFKYEALTIRPDSTLIVINDASDADLGLGIRIQERLLKCQKWVRLNQQISLVVLAGGLVLALILVLVMLGLVARGLMSARAESVLSVVSMAITGVALVGFLSFVFPNKFVKFRPEAGERTPINWRGATWQLALLLIGAVVGALVKTWRTKCP